MLIGDIVIYEGRAYTVVGFTAVSVTPAKVQLEPRRGGRAFWVDASALTEPIAPERAAFRIGREPDGAA
jgi:hypothetical protein